MLPVGLEENQFFKVTTSSVPLYQTKNLGLTQYTPNRVTSYLGNYNEDMRRIDKFSVSIGAYVEKVIDEADEAHEILNQKIINNTSIIAFAEQRIDTLEETITELQTDIGNVRVEVDEKISESENKIIEEIGKIEAATSSVTAYLEQEIKDVDTKHTLANNALSQRIHVAEDEILSLKQQENIQTTQISDLQTRTTALETKTAGMQQDIDNNMGDITTLQGDMATAKSNILSLQRTDRVQNSTIESLTEQVAAIQDIGGEVNKLKARTNIVIASLSRNTITINEPRMSVQTGVDKSLDIFYPTSMLAHDGTMAITVTFENNILAGDKVIFYIPNLTFVFDTGSPTAAIIKTGTIVLSLSTKDTSGKSIVMIGRVSISVTGANNMGKRIEINNNNLITMMDIKSPYGQASGCTLISR